MQLITNQFAPHSLPPVAVALGTFDGLHRGHMALLEGLKQAAFQRGIATCVYTFDKHPSCFKSDFPAPLLTPLPLKLNLLSQAGIDYCFVEHVSADYFNLSPQDFVQQILHDKCGAAFVTAGFNYRFGKGRSGTPEQLQSLCRGLKLDCSIQEPVLENGGAISSTRVRALVAEGNLPAAAHLLGRYFEICGLVTHGHQRGRTLLGFPTANLYPPPALQLPPNGVYLTYAVIDGVRYPAVTNIGRVPTFGEQQVSVEAHLLDFDGNLYGKQMKVELVQSIRFEQKFDSVDALRRQISADTQAARALIGKEPLL